MLSRTAENLYWSARYIERADSIARILEVGYRISLIPNTQKGYSNEWEAILQSSGIKEEYLSKYKEIKKDKIEYFLLLDENKTSSIIISVSGLGTKTFGFTSRSIFQNPFSPNM